MEPAALDPLPPTKPVWAATGPTASLSKLGTPLQKGLNDALLSLDEENALAKYVDHFGLTQPDLVGIAPKPVSWSPG